VLQFLRTPLLLVVLLSFFGGFLPAQKKKKPGDEDGYIPVVITDTKKKKDEDITQSLPPPKDLPNVVVAETERLTYSVSSLLPKGLLSAQTREILKGMVRSSRGNIVKLRAFVAGSGDLRRIGEIVGEAFTEKHLNLPVLSVVQVGGLPMEGAQVVIETTELDKRSVNSNGVAFISGQSASSVSESLEKIKRALRGGGMEPDDALRVTCFVSSLEDQRNIRQAMASSFPNAALNYVQMQREPVTPAVECEAVARIRVASSPAMRFLNPPDLDKSPYYTQAALVTSPKLVITGTQLAFGSQEADFKLAFDRLQRALASSNARLEHVVMSHQYMTSRSIIDRLRAVRANYFSTANPPASTLLPFEGLPSLDASFGIDVIAVPDSTAAQR